jgi:hypothetical protein
MRVSKWSGKRLVGYFECRRCRGLELGGGLVDEGILVFECFFERSRGRAICPRRVQLTV